VVVVNNLDERLDLGTLSDLLLAHGASDLKRVTLDTGDDSVTVGSVLGTFVVVY